MRLAAKRRGVRSLLVACLVVALASAGLLCAPAWPSLDGTAGVSSSVEQDLTWKPNSAPDYYAVVGRSQVGDVPAPGEVRYGELDILGRATGVRATITYDLMRAGEVREREDMSGLAPAGWGANAEVDIALPDGGSYHGYFWNRSHLLAKSLGGVEDLCNLITGTRMQNVGANDGHGGMAYGESLCREWLGSHPQGTLAYAATPCYVGDELVPRAVVVDMCSSDRTLDERVIVYNAALGYDIDYQDGSFWAS